MSESAQVEKGLAIHNYIRSFEIRCPSSQIGLTGASDLELWNEVPSSTFALDLDVICFSIQALYLIAVFRIDGMLVTKH